MARRYGRSFGEPISFVPEYIEEPADLIRIMESKTMTPVIIDATDNNKTRLVLHHAMEKYADEYAREVLSLSSGNEERAGQVVFSYREKYFNNSVDREENSASYSPGLFEIFPNAEVDRLPTELSCAEQAVSAPQNIHANLTAANLLFGFVNKLINFEAVNELLIFFNTVSQMTTVYRGTKSDVRDLLSKVDKNNSLFNYLPDEDHGFEAEDGLDVPSLDSFVLEEII